MGARCPLPTLMELALFLCVSVPLARAATATPQSGWTALFVAAAEGYTKIVTALLDAGNAPRGSCSTQGIGGAPSFFFRA